MEALCARLRHLDRGELWMVFDGRTRKMCFHEKVRVNVCRVDEDWWQRCESRDYTMT